MGKSGSKQFKIKLQQTYRRFGVKLQEFDYQALIRAHLGDGPMPILPSDEVMAVPFIERLNRYLHASGEIFTEHYDYGKKIIVPTSGDAISRLSTAPKLSCLLNIMGDDGHSIEAAIEELNQMRILLSQLLTHMRAVKVQTDATLSGIQSLLSEVESDAPTQLPGGGLE